jgi:opacity protein-like surface antigen
MLQRLSFVVVGLLMFGVASTSAQRIETSFTGGYSASEGVTSDDRLLLGQLYNGLDLEGGGSFNLTFAVLFKERMGVEFLFGRQSSRLIATGPGGKLDVSDAALYNYMFNYVYNWSIGDSKIVPYAFGGIGATTHTFGDLLLTPPSADRGPGQIDAKTRFSTNWGGGLKFYPGGPIGLKFETRWTPTYIKSDPGGTWCDPYYGCWLVGDPQYANQFETAGGITFRFD